MRKGSKRRDWTVSEEKFLIANAGFLTKRDICELLKRPAESVTQKVKALRRQGHDISLRCFESTLEPCPSCGHQSATIGRKGICEPCRRRDQLATIHARIADLMPLLSNEERDIYEKTEAEIESSRDPLPKAPNTRHLSRYKAMKADEEHAIALERCVSNNLRREVKAAQKRKERIEEKVTQKRQINDILPDRSN